MQTLNKLESDIQVFEKLPVDFSPIVEVSAVFLRVQGKTLILQRTGSEKGFWGLPAGKIETDENPEKAAIREFWEETQIQLPLPLKPLGQLYFRKPKCDYTFHMFDCRMEAFPQVTLNSEHSDYGWFSKKDVEKLPLMRGGQAVFHYYHNILNNL